MPETNLMGLLGLRKFYRLSLVSSNPIVLQTTRALSGFKNANANDPILPVLIVGAGPVGLILSFFLTNLGVKCAVIEKNKVFSEHPQAHVINNRSMELFRKVDGLAEDILKSQPPVDYWRKFIYCTSLTGPILGSVDHMRPEGISNLCV